MKKQVKSEYKEALFTSVTDKLAIIRECVRQSRKTKAKQTATK
jgi:hypothetical protein